jgi:uncharacterized protein YjbJ (UPF0337 family)
MDDKLKGKGENIKGRAKQAAGSLTGNKGLEAEGAAERVKGAAKEKVAEVKKDLDEDEEVVEEEDRED